MKRSRHKQGDTEFYLFSPESALEKAILNEFDFLIYQHIGWASKYECFQEMLKMQGEKQAEELSAAISTILNTAPFDNPESASTNAEKI